jgi:hypothetical protein
MDGRRVLGVLLLIAGIAIGIFGLSYINSAQYKAMSMVNDFTGSRSDPTGMAAIIIGSLLAVGGIFALLTGSGGSDPNAPSPDTHVRCPDCKELVRKEATVCKHCGCKLRPQPETMSPKRDMTAKGECKVCGKQLNWLERTNMQGLCNAHLEH